MYDEFIKKRNKLISVTKLQAGELAGGPNVPTVQPIFDLKYLGLRTRVSNEAQIRGAAQNAYLGNDTSLCRVLGRYKMYVDTRDLLISSHLLLDGFWEMWTTEVINKLVKPGMVVADIGANLGYFTLLMSDLVGPTGEVHAFEPNPEMTRRLRQSVIVNGFAGRAKLHPLFLGRADAEQMALRVLVDEPGGGSMVPVDAAGPDAPIFTTHRLDSRDDWRRIELAKIDVEGAEEAVLEGAGAMLDPGSALKTVVLEFAPARYADPGAFLDRIESYGFSVSVIDPYWGVVKAARDDLIGGHANGDAMLVLQR